MTSFLQWAKASLTPLSTVYPGPPCDDLAPFGRMIGDATVVALSEGAHGANEPLEFRNRLFQYLVREKGFTAIAIEASGVVEGRCIHDYVRSAEGDLDAAILQGHNFGFEVFPQTRALVQWMRQHNADPTHSRKIHFYGLDMAGVFSTTQPYCSNYIPLRAVLQFLEQVDEPAGQAFTRRFEPFLNVRFHSREPLEGRVYGALSQAERDTLTAAIADLIIWIERHEGPYLAVSTAREYAWAYGAAIAARQMDNFLRQCPLGWVPSQADANDADSLSPFHFVMSDIRDRVWADNLEWILEQEGVGAKVLIFGARYHLSAVPLKVSWSPHRQVWLQHVAGSYLRRRLGEKLVTIGNLIGQGDASWSHEFERAPADSLDGMAGQAGVPLYLLDLRRAPPDVAEELHQEHALVAQTQTLKLPPRQAFDILFYIDTVSRAGGSRANHPAAVQARL